MFHLLLTLPLLALLYALYFMGAVAFSAYPRSRPKINLPAYLGMGLLALIPALFLVDFFTEMSADFDHRVPGWIGLPAIIILLAVPWKYSTGEKIAERLKGPAPFSKPDLELSGAHSEKNRKYLAFACLLVALGFVTQLNMTVSRSYAEGVVVSRIPYVTRSTGISGRQRIVVTVAFPDDAGKKHFFSDETQHVPHLPGAAIGVFYSPAAPDRKPLPDLGGWEHSRDLATLFIIFIFGCVAFTGLGLATGKKKAPPSPTPAPPPSPALPEAVDFDRPHHPLTPVLDRAKEDLRQAILDMGYSCDSIFYAGAYDIAPHHLFFGVQVKTDSERERMNADIRIDRTVRRILRERGYPAEAIPKIGARCESQETVDRDWEGNWYQAWR